MVDLPRPQPAYLATRGAGGWRDLYRLDPAAVTTVGRSTDCRVVLPDERASRTHAEVFARPAETGDKADLWFVRDRESRNGTAVNGEPLPSGGERALAGGR